MGVTIGFDAIELSGILNFGITKKGLNARAHRLLAFCTIERVSCAVARE